MESFPAIVKGFYSLSITTNFSVLDVCRDPGYPSGKRSRLLHLSLKENFNANLKRNEIPVEVCYTYILNTNFGFFLSIGKPSEDSQYFNELLKDLF